MLDRIELKKVADRVREGLRQARIQKAEIYRTQGRNYQTLDQNIYVNYVMESFLYALNNSERAKHFVMKGGNLFRVWPGFDTPRPTSDLDMQCLWGEGQDWQKNFDILAEIIPIVCTEEFQSRTGLVFEPEYLKVERIEHSSVFPYKIEGPVFLGPRDIEGYRPTEIQFCLEITCGPAPEGGFALNRWRKILQEEQAFAVVASKPEWMAAEKFHAVISRGPGNTRLKDFYDLKRLFEMDGFDDSLFKRSIKFVFEEQRQTNILPSSGENTAFSPEFASPSNERFWQTRRWKEWEGREWNSKTDPTLLQTTGILINALEDKGVFEKTPLSGFMKALVNLEQASLKIEEGYPYRASDIAKFVSSLRAIYASYTNIPPSDISWRWWSKHKGNEHNSLVQMFELVATQSLKKEIHDVIQIGWQKDSREINLALAELSCFFATVPNLLANLNAASNTHSATQQKSTKQKQQSTTTNLLAEGIEMISNSKGGEFKWFGGLSKILQYDGNSNLELPDNFVLDVPGDERAFNIWLRIAAKNKLNTNLEEAVEEVRNKLGYSTASSLKI